MIWIAIIIHGLIAAVLTVLTQIGGAAYLFAVVATGGIEGFFRKRLYRLLLFAALYGGLSVAARHVAPIYGRVPLSCLTGPGDEFRLASPLFCLMNRNYVSRPLRGLVIDLSIHMDQQFPNSLTQGLDAGFPFFDGFPLWPHLSHSNGNQLDLAFYYQARDGRYERGALSSPVGYWTFEVNDGPDICPETRDFPDWRWDMAWFQRFVDRKAVDADRTREAMRWLVEEGPKHGLSKIFLEPHLAKKWGITGNTVRFQGCNAARHDDHIHIQLKG